jgi:hypothetical protein
MRIRFAGELAHRRQWCPEPSNVAIESRVSAYAHSSKKKHPNLLRYIANS